MAKTSKDQTILLKNKQRAKTDLSKTTKFFLSFPDLPPVSQVFRRGSLLV